MNSPKLSAYFLNSRLISVMERLREEAGKDSHIEINRFFLIMGTESHALLLVFLCLPYLQPIPIPGLSTPFGALICVVAFFLYLDKPAVLPRRFQHLKLSSELVLKITEVAEKVWMRVYKRIHSRWEVFFTQPVLRFLSLVAIVSNAILLALPLPIPFSNTVPVITILLNALGQMERDGLFILLSYLWSLVCFAFFMGLGLGTVGIFQSFQ